MTGTLRSRITAALAALVAVPLLVISAPATASAQSCGDAPGIPYCSFQPNRWQEWQHGQFSNGTRHQGVKSWQNILWIDGRLSSTGEIDGIFGSVTNSATRNWQSGHGLTADGWVGYNTWYRARNGSHTYRLADNSTATTYHLTQISAQQYVYRERPRTTRSGNYWWSGLHWSADRVGCVNNTTYTSCVDS